MKELIVGCKRHSWGSKGGHMKGLRIAGLWIFLAVAAVPTLAQRSTGGTSRPIPGPGTSYPSLGGIGSTNPVGPMGGEVDPLSPPDVLSGRIAAQQARSRNNERQKRLESDTDKLVDLVNSLKEQVQGEKELSPADIGKRAEEIEKLARSVKDKMRG